mgnify:CR=1 FL=1
MYPLDSRIKTRRYFPHDLAFCEDLDQQGALISFCANLPTTLFPGWNLPRFLNNGQAIVAARKCNAQGPDVTSCVGIAIHNQQIEAVARR